MFLPGRLFGDTQNFEKARIFGVAGETSNLYLIPEGVYFHPQYNDVTGDTDKLLTSSMKLGVLDRAGEDWSYEACYFWRFITPAFASSTKSGLLASPVGIYADWMEVKTAVAKIIRSDDMIFRPQISIGLNHIGNKGAKKIHRWVHKVTKNSLEGLEYTNQPIGYFAAGGANVSVARDLVKMGQQSIGAQALVGYEGSKIMQEAFADTTFLWTVRKTWWEMAFDVRIVRQVASDVYEGIKPYRFECAASTALYKVFTPSIKYVSSYLDGDDVGQTYFDFVHFNYAF